MSSSNFPLAETLYSEDFDMLKVLCFVDQVHDVGPKRDLREPGGQQHVRPGPGRRLADPQERIAP
jgi:hypothetical protein